MGISQQKATLEHYFTMEAATNEKLEYINGAIRSMAGTTFEHEVICNILVELLNQCLRDKGCWLMSGNMKLFTPECSNSFLYPDIHIYCGEIKKEKMKRGAYALKDPTIIIEVLSASTSDYDKNEKFECYRKMKSLQKYIMIESDLVEENNQEEDLEKPIEKKEPKIYVRTLENEKKFIENVLDLEDTLEILGCKVNVRDIYSYFL